MLSQTLISIMVDHVLHRSHNVHATLDASSYACKEAALTAAEAQHAQPDSEQRMFLHSRTWATSTTKDRFLNWTDILLNICMHTSKVCTL